MTVSPRLVEVYAVGTAVGTAVGSADPAAAPPAENEYRFGSGWTLGRSAVLTAAHVVPEGTTGPGTTWSVRLRPAAAEVDSPWFHAEVCWRDRQRDLVLLHVVDRGWTPPAEPDRGHAPPGAEVRECEVLGLPYELTMPGGERDIFQGDGRLFPAYRQRSAHGPLRVRLLSGLTTTDGWRGMSGGPVLDRQGQLLALVVAVPDQPDQLLVSDTRSLPYDPHFSTAFAACHQPDLTPPEPPPDPRPALQEEFERALASSPLLAETGLVRLLAHDVARQLRKPPATDYGTGGAEARAMALVADFGDEPPGIRAIVRSHARMSPQEERLNRRLLRRADAWDSLASPLVVRIEDWLDMRVRLQGFPLDASALPNIDWPTTKTFWRTVNLDGSEHPPAHCATAWHAFTHLLCRNAATEGLPYAMRFVEELAHASAPETCGELQAANRQWAVQLGLGEAIDLYRDQMLGLPRPHEEDLAPTVVLELLPDGLRSGHLQLVGHLQQNAHGWRPIPTPRRSVHKDQLAREVDRLIGTVEPEREAGRLPLIVAFLLPVSLLPLAVERLERPGGQPLGVRYPVVLRSWDREADQESLYGLWTAGWTALVESEQPAVLWDTGEDFRVPMPSAEQSPGSVAVLSGAPGRRWEQNLQDVVLAGVPVALWHREGRWDPALQSRIRSLLDGPAAQLPRRVWELRRAAANPRPGAVLDEVDADLARHLALLWDDPAKLIRRTRR